MGGRRGLGSACASADVSTGRRWGPERAPRRWGLAAEVYCFKLTLRHSPKHSTALKLHGNREINNVVMPALCLRKLSPQGLRNFP